jgi:hypothetical protein
MRAGKKKKKKLVSAVDQQSATTKNYRISLTSSVVLVPWILLAPEKYNTTK